MFRRPALGRVTLLTCAFVLVLPACGSDDDDRAEPTSVAPTTASNGTTVVTTGTTQTTESSSPSTDTTLEPIPPITPPANQPEACSLLDESALAAVGVPPGTSGSGDAGPDGMAPSTGCFWYGDPGVSLALFYGVDPIELLATARQVAPEGVDVVGVGQDAYFATGVLIVDAGSRAFLLSGGPTQEQLVTLAQNVISNL